MTEAAVEVEATEPQAAETADIKGPTRKRGVSGNPRGVSGPNKSGKYMWLVHHSRQIRAVKHSSVPLDPLKPKKRLPLQSSQRRLSLLRAAFHGMCLRASTSTSEAR